MLTDTTMATIREALTLLKDHHVEWSRNEYGNRKVAQLDAAIAELEQLGAQQGEWEPLANGTYHTDGPEVIRVKDARLTIHSNSAAYADLSQGYALCHRTTKGAE